MALNGQTETVEQTPLVSVDQLREGVVAALRTVFDPEIPVNIYDLGLIYDIDINDDRKVHVKMTLTAPGCPVAQTFPQTVEQAIYGVSGVTVAVVELVWEPPWDKDRMSEGVKLQLGML